MTQDQRTTYAWELNFRINRLFQPGAHSSNYDFDHVALAKLLQPLTETFQEQITTQMVAFFRTYRNLKLFGRKMTIASGNRRINRLSSTIADATDYMLHSDQA